MTEETWLHSGHSTLKDVELSCDKPFYPRAKPVGSFADTCCISGLPIEAGDEVRYLLLSENPYCEGGFVCEMHGRWVPRTWPIRARYNDYGSIEDYEENAVQRSFLKGLQKDLVEVGVGDNSVHDVAAKKDMSFEQLLEAIWEGQVKILRDVGRAKLKGEEAPAGPPPYVPSLAHVEEALYTIELPENGRYLVDEQDNWTRVRWDHLRFVDSDKEHYWLTCAAEVLNKDFATVVTAGSGSYAHNEELRVFIAPGKSVEGQSRRAEWQDESKGPPLLIQQAMIREDVWQALIKMTIKSWDGSSHTVDQYRTNARKYILEQADLIRTLQGNSHLSLLLRFGMPGGREPGTVLVSQNLIPFSVGLCTHACLILEDEDADLEAFSNTVAEFDFIWSLLGDVRYVWRPSDTAGPQGGEWQSHVDYLQTLTEVAKMEAAAQAEARKDWDE